MFLVFYYFSPVGLLALITETTGSTRKLHHILESTSRQKCQAARSGHDICFPSDHSLILPVVQYLKIVVSDILSSFLVVHDERAILARITTFPSFLRNSSVLR